MSVIDSLAQTWQRLTQHEAPTASTVQEPDMISPAQLQSILGLAAMFEPLAAEHAQSAITLTIAGLMAAEQAKTKGTNPVVAGISAVLQGYLAIKTAQPAASVATQSTVSPAPVAAG